MDQLTVGDLMTRNVISAKEHTPVKELVGLMKQHNISGLPVVDDDGVLAGIVSEVDLLTIIGAPSQEGVGTTRKRTHGWVDWLLHSGRSATVEDQSDISTAASFMTRDVVTALASTPIREAARAMIESRVKRLPIVNEANKVVGIISRQDLLRPFLQSDEKIRQEVLDNLAKRVLWIDPSKLNVVVDKGVVDLHGHVALRSQKEILIELARRVDGVVAVEDHLLATEDDRQAEPEWMRRESRDAEPWARVAHMLGYRSPDDQR
jgi:CBS domain-containing protein